MAKLVRVGEAPDLVRVNFTIKRDKHPELVHWLHNLPVGSMSVEIRQVLEAHIGVGTASRPPASNFAPPPPVVTQASLAPQGGTASSPTVSDATAGVLSSMRDQL